jgi:hypothetical protein
MSCLPWKATRSKNQDPYLYGGIDRSSSQMWRTTDYSGKPFGLAAHLERSFKVAQLHRDIDDCKRRLEKARSQKKATKPIQRELELLKVQQINYETFQQ